MSNSEQNQWWTKLDMYITAFSTNILMPQWDTSYCVRRRLCDGSQVSLVPWSIGSNEKASRLPRYLPNSAAQACLTPKGSEVLRSGLCFVLNLAPCYLARTLWSEMPSQWVTSFRVRRRISSGSETASITETSLRYHASIRQLNLTKASHAC